MQHRLLTIEDRVSDSPFVERIWTARGERAGEFLSVVASHWEMVVTRLHRQAFLTVRGPETRATPADCPLDGDWVAVRFKLEPSGRRFFRERFAIGVISRCPAHPRDHSG